MMHTEMYVFMIVFQRFHLRENTAGTATAPLLLALPLHKVHYTTET